MLTYTGSSAPTCRPGDDHVSDDQLNPEKLASSVEAPRCDDILRARLGNPTGMVVTDHERPWSGGYTAGVFSDTLGVQMLTPDTLIAAIVFVVVGLAMLAFGGEALVRGAVATARRLQMSTVVIGLTIVAMATSLPELAVSLSAEIRGSTDVAIGNVVGIEHLQHRSDPRRDRPGVPAAPVRRKVPD